MTNKQKTIQELRMERPILKIEQIKTLPSRAILRDKYGSTWTKKRTWWRRETTAGECKDEALLELFAPLQYISQRPLDNRVTSSTQAPENWSPGQATGHPATQQTHRNGGPVFSLGDQLGNSFSETGHPLHPHKQADPTARVTLGDQFLQHVGTTRAHINLTTTRAQETAQQENRSPRVTRPTPATEHANEPRTFAQSERAQERRRWRVDKGMHFWFASEPIGPDGRTITIFPTFADAIAFADRQARS
ncbi:hypothetical protein F8O06_02820 [Pseudoclavibacter sp. CFCC 14310]|uniref:hypothetical protein n=1 Tax=Pseudoclavibacter sp. CFCC 14310 TaxID=2615180 RepID=UPI0013017B9E|nr:hypothetical protein [Pseudoclavibacter sp. CFCC 14310]KAB1647490.1 hypothetical protein F8O06_02820 [Pseudoclavibacter sp. CFCC 14310]